MSNLLGKLQRLLRRLTVSKILSIANSYRSRMRLIVPELAYLPFLDPDLVEKIPSLMQIRESVQDIFLWLATVVHHALSEAGIGDEYGVYEPLVRAAAMGDSRAARSLMFYREFVEVPRYVVIVSVLVPTVPVRLLQYRDIAGIPMVLKVAQTATVLDMPFTVIADLRDIHVTPTPVDPQWLQETATTPRVPGPRLYLNIERCLICGRGDREETCQALIVDGACMPPEKLGSLDDLVVDREIIYVEKKVKHGDVLTSRRILVAFCYSLSKMLTDEDTYRAYCVSV